MPLAEGSESVPDKRKSQISAPQLLSKALSSPKVLTGHAVVVLGSSQEGVCVNVKELWDTGTL